MYDSFYTKCPEQTNAQGEKVDWPRPGPGERGGGGTARGSGILSWGGGNALLESGDDCTTLNILKTTELYTLKWYIL